MTVIDGPPPVAQDVVDELARSIGRPVVLDDAALRLVAHSVQDGPIDAARSQTILLRSTEPATAAALFALGIATARAPMRLPGLPELDVEARLCVPVRGGGRAVGYLWVIDQGHSLTEQQVCRVAEAAEHLRFMLPSVDEESFGDVLTRSRRLRAALADDLHVEDLLPAGMTGTLLVACDLLEAGSRRSEVDLVVDLQSRLDALPGAIAWTVCHSERETVALAVSRATSADRSAAARTLWEALTPVRSPGTRIGTSPLEGTVADSHRRANAALWVADVQGGRPGPVVHWAELGYWRLLAAPLMRPGAADLMAVELSPRLLTLVETSGADDLLPTLRAYLTHGGDVRACAAELHVHRSTLYYRLQRLTEVLDVDLRDGSVRFELMLALCVLDARAVHPPAPDQQAAVS